MVTSIRINVVNSSPSFFPYSFKKDSIILRVSDSGPGIPIEDQSRIFERFYRRGSELRRETQGIGLGLTIVRQVAESHQGSIRVDSHPGQGATFLLELPVDPSSQT